MAITMKAARVNAQLTQRQAANAVGISKNTLCNYEKGKSIPKVDIAKKLADLYGMRVSDIIFFANGLYFKCNPCNENEKEA